MTRRAMLGALARACAGLLIAGRASARATGPHPDPRPGIESPHSPARIYQSVAAGLLGRDSFQGGLATAALGMFLHFFIATTAAAVYVAASTRRKLLLKQPVPCGLAFGVAVYFFMNLVVVPLSRAGGRGFSFSWRLMVGHALLVGLPIALVARRRLDVPMS